MNQNNEFNKFIGVLILMAFAFSVIAIFIML